LSPIVPDRLLPIRLLNVPLAGTRVDITVEADGGVDVGDLPAGTRLITAHPDHSTSRTAAQQHDQRH
jgi:hypothetical protein